MRIFKKYRSIKNDLQILELEHSQILKVSNDQKDFISLLQKSVNEKKPQEKVKEPLKLFKCITNNNKADLGDPEEIYIFTDSIDRIKDFVDLEEWYIEKECAKDTIIIKRKSTL